MKEGSPRLVLANHYGNRNVGDEAIVTAMIDSLRDHQAMDITFLSRSPDYSTRAHPDIKVVSSGVLRGMPGTVRAIREADLLLFGGGGLLQDHTSVANVLFQLSRPLLASLLGTPFMCYALGVGPLKSALSCWLTKTVLQKAEMVLVRDQDSLDTLGQIGLVSPSMRVTADPALLLSCTESAQDAPVYRRIAALRDGNGCIICISLRPPVLPRFRLDGKEREERVSGIVDVMAEVANVLIKERNAYLVFVSMHPNEDDAIGSTLLNRLDNPERMTIVPGTSSPKTVMAVLGLADLIVGMRLHSLILGASQGIPVIGLSYDAKVRSFMAQIHQECRILEPEHWTVDNLIQQISDVWRARVEVSAQIKTLVGPLKASARENNAMVLKLLSSTKRCSR